MEYADYETPGEPFCQVCGEPLDKNELGFLECETYHEEEI